MRVLISGPAHHPIEVFIDALPDPQLPPHEPPLSLRERVIEFLIARDSKNFNTDFVLHTLDAESDEWIPVKDDYQEDLREWLRVRMVQAVRDHAALGVGPAYSEHLHRFDFLAQERGLSVERLRDPRKRRRWEYSSVEAFWASLTAQRNA